MPTVEIATRNTFPQFATGTKGTSTTESLDVTSLTSKHNIERNATIKHELQSGTNKAVRAEESSLKRGIYTTSAYHVRDIDGQEYAVIIGVWSHFN